MRGCGGVRNCAFLTFQKLVVWHVVFCRDKYNLYTRRRFSGKRREWSFLQVQLVHRKKVLRTRPGKDGSGLFYKYNLYTRRRFSGLVREKTGVVFIMDCARCHRVGSWFKLIECIFTWFFVFGSSGLRVWCLLPVPDVPYNDF
jgi:hypothetical protein